MATASASLETQLSEELKKYMLAKDAAKVACIRQLKSKVQEAVNARDFQGPIDDALYQRVTASYVKSLEKASAELAAAGARSQPLRDQYAAEIQYLARFLPSTLDAAQTQKLVDAAVATLAHKDPKLSGKVIGMLMKEHRGQLDPALTRQLVEATLGA